MTNNNLDLYQKYSNRIGNNDENDVITKKENIKSKISSINMEYEYSLNEIQKRAHRTKILDAVLHLTFIQLIFFNIIVAAMLSSVIIELPFFKIIDKDITSLILEFLKYYVSATIVELLGMFLFIIKNVFDSSLKDFWKNAKK